MTSTPTRLLVLGAGCCLALSGCGSSTVRTGAAATVGDERITDTALQKLVDRSLADPAAKQSIGADRAGFQRAALGRLIQHDVVQAAAKKEGVTVSAAAVDKTVDQITAQLGGPQMLKQQAAKAGIAPSDLRRTFTDVTVQEALGDKLVAGTVVPPAVLKSAYQQGLAQYDQVHSAHILVAKQALAQQILAKVKADPSSFAALAAQYSTDPGSKTKGGDLGFQGRGVFTKVFEQAIFNNKPGSFVLVKSEFGYHIIHVIERRTTTLAQATPALRRTVLAQPRQAALTKLLQDTASRLGVHVNPRFGRWDPKTLAVVAATPNPSSATTHTSPGASPSK